jgi:hypothetical protein
LLLIVAVVLLSLVLTKWLGFLLGASIIFIGAETIIAVKLHLLAPRSTSRRSGKPVGAFRLRTDEETIISIAFALAGIASLTGVLHGGRVAGWLAVGAAAAGAANIVVTRRSTVAGSDGP